MTYFEYRMKKAIYTLVPCGGPNFNVIVEYVISSVWHIGRRQYFMPKHLQAYYRRP